MTTRIRVLMVEDSETDRKLVEHELQRAGFAVDSERVEDAAGVRAALARGPWDLVLSDWTMPRFRGSDALALVRENGGDVPFIIVSGTVGEEAAVAALRNGAQDFLVKGNLGRLGSAVQRQLDERGERAARRRADEQLRASEARYRALFDLSPLPKWLFEVESLRFLEVNEAAVQHYGYSREEFLAMTLRDIRPAEDVEAMLAVVRVLAPGRDHHGALRHRKKDGTLIEVEVTGHTFSFEGRLCRLVALVDVTERRAKAALEAQLRQAQRLEAIGRLTGGIAHDFNNVLTAVLSNAAFLLEELPEERWRADAREIFEAAERAAALTRQLLTFSRKQLVDPVVLDLNQVCAGIEKMLRRLIGEDVALTLVLDPSLGRVRADPGQLEQVLVNLVVNARDAMPGGGAITVRTENVTLGADYADAHLSTAPGDYVLFSVSDTGSGMTAEVQQHLFEPFFTTKEQGKGTGLGLSTSYGIVRQSGGTIWVYSEPGHGSVFKVYLPRVEAPARAAPEERRATPGAGGTETVLLLDDDEKVRAAAERILHACGYTVLAARSPDEAMAIAREHPGPIELLLSDVVMPGASGPEVAEVVRGHRPGIAVLFLSGFTEHAVVEKARAGGAGYLQKPFTPELLAGRVREVLDRSKA